MFDSVRFIKICGLLASDQIGERASAALHATQMLNGAGLTWADVTITRQRTARPEAEDSPRATRDPSHYRNYVDHLYVIDGVPLVDAFQSLFEIKKTLNDWEQRFLFSMMNRIHLGYSERQAETLKRIYRKSVLQRAH